MKVDKEQKDNVRVIIWNVYLDQHQLILAECRDGKSYSEILRRIIDFGMNNRLDLKYRVKKSRTQRELHKSNFGVTPTQYNWFTENFPPRKKGEGLRYIIDQYFKTKKEEK
jgi:hypothetical protein